MTIPNSRTLQLFAFLGAVFLMATALFFEHVMELKPCPLCISQRIAVILLGLIALLATLHNPKNKGRRIYGILILIAGIAGLSLALRQLYLQSLPPGAAPACMPSMEYMIDVLPWAELASVMLNGTGDCAEVKWLFLGQSMPFWTAVAFSIYTLFGLFETVRKQELY